MLEIEIVEVNIIDGGVEVFARAWRDGVQIGFGKDGTVDIERFRIFNPPILVDDPNGNIIRQSQYEDPDTGEIITHQRVLREDPEEALIQVIEHNISVMDTKDDTNIISGKRGNTTSTFYPDPHPETTTVDGEIRYEVSKGTESYATARAKTTGTYSNDGATNPWLYLGHTQDATAWRIYRSKALFDTSSIGSDSVTSATLSVYGTSIVSNNSDSDGWSVVSATMASSDTALTTADYDITTFGSTSFGSVTFASFSTSAYNDISLNASGLSNINGSGVSRFGFLTTNDLSATQPSGSNRRIAWAVDQTGTAQDPKLVVEHTAAASTFTPRVIFY